MQTHTDSVRIPAPTAWPMILAFGVALLAAGLVTNVSVTGLGALLAGLATVGWFRNVFPSEAHVMVRINATRRPPAMSRRAVAHVHIASQLHRARLPLEIYPVAAGIKGGLAGGVAMALLAMAYGIVSGHGIWYPVNLLAAGFFPGAAMVPTSEIARFHAVPLFIAAAIHAVTCLLVGVLYGAMLPILPRRPIVLGGLAAPIAWSAILHSVLNIVNPVMNQRIDWFWFVLSQVGFGIVAGLVVTRQERVQTWQGLPLAVRAGLKAPGLIRKHDGGGQP